MTRLHPSAAINLATASAVSADSGQIGDIAWVEITAHYAPCSPHRPGRQTMSVAFSLPLGDDPKATVDRMHRAAAAFNAEMLGIASPLHPSGVAAAPARPALDPSPLSLREATR